MPTKLTSDRVHELFLDCLFRDEELAGGMPYTRVIKGEGITKTAGFCAERLEGHRAEIAELCEELPPEFKDGWSFLNMCNTKDGELWTGEHRTMEELVMLGMAAGKIKLCAPKELWSVLPGGMPYYQVTREEAR